MGEDETREAAIVAREERVGVVELVERRGDDVHLEARFERIGVVQSDPFAQQRRDGAPHVPLPPRAAARHGDAKVGE